MHVYTTQESYLIHPTASVHMTQATPTHLVIGGQQLVRGVLQFRNETVVLCYQLRVLLTKVRQTVTQRGMLQGKKADSQEAAIFHEQCTYSNWLGDPVY